MPNSNNPNSYLESICREYAQWWKAYTLTDVTGRQPDLMVQTFQQPQERERQERDKIERLDVLEGLRKYTDANRDDANKKKEDCHVLLVGRPGSGKSTALKRLLLEEARTQLEAGQTEPEREPERIPILVELRYMGTQARATVLDGMRAFLLQHNLEADEATLKTGLRRGRYLLLLDGLNELPPKTESDKNTAWNEVLVFRKDYPKTPMVFATRDLGVGGDLNITRKLEMQPLTEGQMKELVCKRLPEAGEQMWRQLGNRLRELGQTPLLLLMLCSLFEARGEVPPNLGLVFRQFTRSFQAQIKQDIPVSAQSRHWWGQLLARLAFSMMSGGSLTGLQLAIPRQEAEEILRVFLREEGFEKPRDCAFHWLDDLRNHHLIQVGAEDTIEFRHQLIQEYYAAEYLVGQLRHLSDENLQRKYLNYLKWTETLTLMLELVADKGQAVRVVELALAVDLRLGARLAGSAKPEFQEQTVGLVLELGVPRLLEVELLGLTRSDWAIERSDCSGNTSQTRTPSRQKPGFRRGLLAQALKDKNEDFDVRRSAVYALGKIGSEKAETALIDALKDRDSGVRTSAASALGDISSEGTVSALIVALEDEDSGVRSSAASALGDISSEKTVSALIAALEDKDLGVRSIAASALGKIGSEKAVSALISALKDEELSVRWSAIYALGAISSEGTVSALIGALEDEELSVRSGAAEALGEIGSRKAVSALNQALKDEKLDVRESAKYALSKIDSGGAIPVLNQALEDEDSDVCKSTTSALIKMDSEGVVSALNQALAVEDPELYVGAVETLGRLGTEAAVSVLIHHGLEHHDPLVRSRAAEALGDIGAEEAVSSLVYDALKDEDSDVRESAAEALGKIGSNGAVLALIDALKDEDWSVYFTAAEALGAIGSEVAVSALISALKDEDFVTANHGQTLSWATKALLAIQERCQFYNPAFIQPEPQLKISPPPLKNMHILHLSDLHFGTPKQANLWAGQLADDLRQELALSNLDALILSGDIANYATPEEYQAAREFLDEFRRDFPLEPQRIIIVPGNHDLNWKLAEEAYTLKRKKHCQPGELTDGNYIPVSEDVVEVRQEEEYRKRFQPFIDFYSTIQEQPYPLDPDNQYTLHTIDNLLILGLNSAWHLDHHYKTRASIHSTALNNALREISRTPDYRDCPLKIAVWHHPIDSPGDDRIRDSNFLERLAVNGFRIFLHGHIHQAQKSFYDYDSERGLHRICAGTFGAPTRELVTGNPWQYHLLQFSGNQLTVRTRKRASETGAWESDFCWRQGKGRKEDWYAIELSPASTTNPANP